MVFMHDYLTVAGRDTTWGEKYGGRYDHHGYPTGYDLYEAAGDLRIDEAISLVEERPEELRRLIDEESAKPADLPGKEARRPAEDSRQSASGAAELFKLVEKAAKSRRAEFMDTGSRLIGSLAEKLAPETAASIGAIDKKMATAAIKQNVERAIAAIDSLNKGDVTPEMRAAMESLKKNLVQFEADGIVAAIIALARKARKADQKLILGLETRWIPDIDERGHGSQHDAINLLLKEIRSIGDTLKGIGLDNVEVVEGDSRSLAGSLLAKAKKTKTDLSNVVVLASSAAVDSESFNKLRSTATEKRAFLAGVDASEIAQFYEANKDSIKASGQQLRIRIMEMLSITLELALGKEPPKLPIIDSYSIKMRTATFKPGAELIDYNVLKADYDAEATTLHNA